MSDRSAWPIVVGGCHRSGTSLLRRLLDAHPRIHCGPETPFFRDFHNEYRDDVYRHLRYATAARSILPEPELLDVLGGAFLEVHARAAARAGKPRWADKAPENVVHLAGWEQLLGDRWLLLAVVRNPLDTLASIAERPFRLTLPADLDGRIEVWRRFTEAALDFREAHPERARIVVYEDLTAEPARELDALMTWLGEAPEPGQLAFNDTGHQSGLEDPKVAATDRVHADSVGRWRGQLSPDDAARAWAATSATWARIDPEGRLAAAAPVA